MPTPDELLDEIYRTGHVEGPDGPVKALPIGVRRAHATALQDAIRANGCTRSLEVGLAYGLSALAITGAHDGPHIAVDPNQTDRFGGIALRNLERAGVRDRVRFFEEPSYATLPRLVAEEVRLDFAFIDGRHIFDTALVDFFYTDLLLEPGGVLVLHDTWWPACALIREYVQKNRDYEELAAPDRAVAFLRKRGDDHRWWWEHRPFWRSERSRTSELRRVVTQRVLRRNF